MNASTRRLALRACGIAMSVASSAARGQGAPRPLPEARLDVLAGRTTSLQAGAGVIVPSGLYVRYVAVAGAGTAWRDGAPGLAARIDLLARFVLDPFRQSTLGLYGAGGVSAVYDDFERWRPRLALAVGLEARPRARGAWAVEVGLGGGVRVGVILRRLAPGRR